MGVRILKGMEANILDYDGNIDVDPDIYQYLDYIIVSMHFPCCEPGTIEENTKAFLNAMENSNVKILGHINDSNYPIDYEIVIKKAKEKNIIIELNNGTLLEGSIRSNGRENAIKVLKICMKYEVPILVGSDAHIFTCVGNFNEACKLIQEVQFPSELILNSDLDKLNKYIRLF